MMRSYTSGCTQCRTKYAQRSIGLGERLCRACFTERFGYLTTREREAIIAERQKQGPQRVAYVPPDRPTRTFRDPRTGELVEFEIVFDGR